MATKPTLEDILATYNSIHPSRRRWYGNTNKLRNSWKELYEILEQASGRSGGKPVVFDPNWHTIVEKGSGIRGASNKAVVITEAPEEHQVETPADVVTIDGAPVDLNEDPLFSAPTTTKIEVTDESEVTPVVVSKKKPAKKRKK